MGLTVRTILLHHGDLLVIEETGKADTRRPSVLHTNPFHLTEADQPAEKILETRSVGENRFDTQQPAVVVDGCCHIGVSVSVDTTSNTTIPIAAPSREASGVTKPPGRRP